MSSINIVSIRSMLREIKLISDSYEKIASVTGENFNIFSVLKAETDEVTTHSRFIAELLNPKGMHGQGDVFLRRFLERINVQEIDTNQVKVKIEYPVGKITRDYGKGGRIDIFIENKTGPPIMIENKIYASDQPRQLARYRNVDPQGKLLYLTLWGSRSDEADRDKIEYDPISYAKDIVKWLEACKKEVADLPILRETITQYLYLVKKLTHQNIRYTMKNEIVDTIISNSENLKTWRKLSDREVRHEVTRRLVSSIVERLVEKFKNKSDFEIVEYMNINNLDVKRYRGILISVQNPKLKSLGVCIRLNFEQPGFNNLIIGLFAEERDGDKKLKGYLDKLSMVPTRSSSLYPAYVDFTEYFNWWTSTLNNIYFNFDDFFTAVEEKIKVFLDILESEN